MQTYRNRKWTAISTVDLLPGDIVSLGKCDYLGEL